MLTNKDKQLKITNFDVFSVRKEMWNGNISKIKYLYLWLTLICESPYSTMTKQS